MEIGEFCRLIRSETNNSIHFYIHNIVLKLTDTIEGSISRTFVPQAGIPLAEWLEQTTYLSSRVKVTLAYTIARSVWQYYNSYWMVTPWTNENIQMMKEMISDRNRTRPRLYLSTKLRPCGTEIVDYYVADDLFHMYPSILGLGVVLVEIAVKHPFRPESHHQLWDKVTINDCYEWAYMTASSSRLGTTIGSGY